MLMLGEGKKKKKRHFDRLRLYYIVVKTQDSESWLALEGDKYT